MTAAPAVKTNTIVKAIISKSYKNKKENLCYK